MIELIEDIKKIFDRHRIYYKYERASKDRHLFRWNDMMRDAGMVADNVILDINIDELHEAIFIGLIRVPHPYRAKGIGKEIIDTFKRYAIEHHFSILVESAPENLPFWQKMHFSIFLFEDYGFWMMGYGGKSKQMFKVKWSQMKPFLYDDEPEKEVHS
ncbi:hypothetical protein BEP19_06500 [Ammoniphilus oxalaticus]|uniref:N-acetyltransferase domain-containing protein n=1 Tax=Ammoniphilus oxalaticus TaxID=66863 RepID=A0A419SJ35_9BACL|nr:hypothetical protein [Ammoniphilus oxalaticus]RKD24054.1 hypothetical protein BEP19_06500 [Ammoniphilus oxalaticus]